MPAEAQQQARLALRDEVKAVAQMQPGDRAPGAAQLAVLRTRKADRRPMHALAHARGQDPDHALVPACFEQRDRGAGRFGERVQRCRCAVEHAALDAAALPVQPVQLLRAIRGLAFLVGNQALDAQAHVGEPAGGIQPGTEDEAEVEAVRFGRKVACGTKQRHHPRIAGARAQALQSLRDQDAVVCIERHHVGDRAQRDQVGQRAQVRLRAAVEPAPAAQLGAQREHHVEHHADARDRLGRKRAARLVRVDDAFRLGKRIAREMVIGDECGDAECLRASHPLDACDAVVYRHDQIGRARVREVHQFRRQAVAELEAIGHEVIDRRAELAQRAHADRAGGCSVGVVIGDDQDPLSLLDRVGEQRRSARRMQQPVGRQQPRGVQLELGRSANPPRRVKAREQRVHAGADQRLPVGLGIRTDDDLHAYAASGRARRQKRRRSLRTVSQE